MANQVGLSDVRQGKQEAGLKLLAPLRYLAIRSPEKAFYDFWMPVICAAGAWGGYLILDPRPPIFGDDGLLRFTRDLLMMAEPFMVGALAAVAMGAPGPYLDRRPPGIELYLNGRILNMRQFVCHLLGYLCFLGLLLLGLTVVAGLVRTDVVGWTSSTAWLGRAVFEGGALVFFLLLSALTVTVFWALYFLTDLVNRQSA